MKGVVFTEFLKMVDGKFGLETVDFIIENADLNSKGAYTSVGTYDFSELAQLIGNLSKHTGIPVDDLIYAYGEYFFDYLTATYTYIFELYNTPITFLMSIEDHIHVHVRKIYPDAELPTFEINEIDGSHFEMIYTSSRALYKFAEGLMVKTFDHYNIQADISITKLHEDGTKVKFLISHA